MTTARILIVENERLVAQGLSRRLSALGHTIVGLATSGEEAMTQADALQPDVVLMDIGLRGAMDGIATARRIRARAPIPIIYLSASTDAQTVARAWQTAPAGYIVKPVPNHALLATIERALEGPLAPG